MSETEVVSELYRIFSCVFKLLRKPGSSQSRANISSEVIKFLEILKNQELEQKIAHFDYTRDFFSWLSLQIFNILYDKDLQDASGAILESFLQILEIHTPRDPLILTGILNIFIESLNNSLARSYHKPRDEPIFSVKRFDLSNADVGCEETKIVVDDANGIQPTYLFFVAVVDRCADVISELDQTFTFEILDVILKLHEFCNEDLILNVLLLINRLIVTVQPTNSYEWDEIYAAFYIHYSMIKKPSLLTAAHFESLYESLHHVVTETAGYDRSLTELMFALSVEIPFTVPTNEPEWVALAVKLLGNLDMRQLDLESPMAKLVSPEHGGFLPLVENYIVKSAQVNLDGMSAKNEPVKYVMDQKSLVWKSCLSVMNRVPYVAYSADVFEKLLDFSSGVISAGRRIAYFLKFKYGGLQPELLGPRCLRSLTAVPFMCHECLSDFCPGKHESLVRYVAAMLGLFAEIEPSKIEDSYLIEHILVVLTLPWNQRCSEEMPASVKVACLEGLVNLAFVLTPERCKTIVSLLTSAIFEKIKQSDPAVQKKFLSAIVLLMFKAPDEQVSDLMLIFKSYLMPENVEMILYNEHIDYKLPCLLANRCVVRNTTDGWKLSCCACDAEPEEPVKFALECFGEYAAVQFVDFMENREPKGDVAKCFLRFINHSAIPRKPQSVRKFVSVYLNNKITSDAAINEVILRLSYSDGVLNQESIAAIYSAIFRALKGISRSNLNASAELLMSLVDLTKKLFKIDFPNSISIFKVLMIHYLSSGLSVCGIRGLLKIALTARNSDFTNFSKSYEPELGKFIVDFILYKSHNEKQSVSSSFVQVLNVLGFKTDEVFVISSLMSAVLTEIIKICDVTTSMHVITEISGLFLLDAKALVEKHYDHIFTEIYSLEDEKIAVQNLIPFLEQCGIDLETSIHHNYSQLVCKLILNSKHPLKIFRFLFQSREVGTENVENQLNALKQHFIGCLTVIESTLNSATFTSLHTAKNYVKCISTFIKILGFRIVTEIQAKLLSTLRSCLPQFYGKFPKHCLAAWVNFCYSVDPKRIGPYLPTILVHLLPLLEKFSDVVSNVFYFFVVENGHHFREQLPLLHFVPCYPNVKMQQVWCVVQSALVVKSNLNRSVVVALENIYSESSETKIIALEHLRMCLKDQAANLAEILNNEPLDPIFESILTSLLDNISHKNNEVKSLCGACLGELGAIDPMKFGFSDAHKTYSPQKYDLTADDFSVLCITKIVHCLGKYDDSRTTGILYSTIQELLRLQLLEKNESDKISYFNKFSQQDQFVLQPLLQTKYIFRGFKMERNNPISFGYHTSKTPCEWATIWACQILARMPASFAKTVFSTCLPAMQIDVEVMETVLPYILLYALLTCDDADLNLLEQEMKYILHWDMSKHRTKPDDLMMIVGESTRSVIHSDVSQTKYVGIILDLLDFINQAVSDCYFFNATLGVPNEDAIDAKIQSFMQRFCHNAMSWKSFVQKDHCRSLYYIEKGCVDDKEVKSLKPLRNIYTKLNDIDGLVGVVKSSKHPPTEEETVVNHMVYGAIQDGLSWYERLSTKYESTNTYRGLIQCYLDINQPSTALAISSHIINSDKYLKPDIFSEHIEALWNSERFLETDEMFSDLDSELLKGHSWSVDLVGVYRLLRKPQHTDVLEKIKSIRLDVVNRLCDLNRNGMTLYRQGYWYIVKLHILNDIETFSDVLFGIPPKGGKFDGFKDAWNYFDRRVAVLPSHGPYIQDIRRTHLETLEVVFRVSSEKLGEQESLNFSNHLGSMWLDSAKKARKNKCLQDAYTCIGIAQRYRPPKLFLELAKYYQAKFDTDSAVMVLQQGLNENPSLMSASGHSEDCKIYAKAKLLTASFNVSSMNLDFNDGYTAFKEAAEICALEKSFVCLASYLYHQHLSETEPDNTAAKRFIQVDSARNFSKSLLYGTKHIYQSMPSMLSLWLDYGARIAKKLATTKVSDENGIMKTLRDFNVLMEHNLICLPAYMFMTAFSQILSRINHRQQSCFDILKSIITRIIQDYPQQAMWSFIAVCRSTNALQKKRTEELCKKIKSADKDLPKFFKVFSEFTEKFIEIALKKMKYSKEVKLTQLNPKLRPLISAYYRSVPIMLPLQKLLTVHIGTGKTGDQHVPFPLTPIYITDVKEEVLMLFSVQMPKRLEFIGSDGEIYPLLCKKDDLRLDGRIMEFNSVINSLLRMDAVAKEKELSIRTYSVVPLNSECGIIEWLSGLLSLKGIISDMYAKLGVPAMPMSQIKKLMLVHKDECDISERLRRFVKVIVPKHPPVLHKWFFDRHPSPDAWYHCRSAFVKSAAVMSIVGYIVGLGDRHGENILIDSKTGEAVHVDFNCLFNRADFLQYPETVPFRLTHSMVRAMGATGVEGLFVTSCEVTNRVMRHNAEQLLSVMKPFLYDMDVKPHNSRKSSSRDTADDQANEEAKTNIQNVEMRLNGVVRSKSDQYAPHRNSKPLSVEGQTRMLIKEATSELNLCQMFAGWAPYM